METGIRVGNHNSHRVNNRYSRCELVKSAEFYATPVCKTKRPQFPEWNPNADRILSMFGVTHGSRILFR